MKNTQYDENGINTSDIGNTANRRLNFISIALPIILFLLCVPYVQASNTTWLIFFIFFVFNAMGIELGLHRYFTHRAFKTYFAVKLMLAVLGTWAFQGPIARWVADHRRHHRFSDSKYDPHSPYVNESGEFKSAFYGFLHAHLFWMLIGKVSSQQKYAADILSDPHLSWISRNYWLIALTGLIIPASIGYAVGGVDEALACFSYAGALRVVVLHQLTWAVNSSGHMFGTQVEHAKGKSRNNPILALLIMGQGLHSSHHTHPNAAILEPKRYDVGGMILITAKTLGLVWDLKN